MIITEKISNNHGTLLLEMVSERKFMKECVISDFICCEMSVSAETHWHAKAIFSDSLLLNDFICISVLSFPLPACCHATSLSKSKQSVKKSFKLTFSSQFKSI